MAIAPPQRPDIIDDSPVSFDGGEFDGELDLDLPTGDFNLDVVGGDSESATSGIVQKPKKRRTSTAEKRSLHNAVERQRRETLNGRFLDLAHLVPQLHDVRRPSKSAIVNKSYDYIRELLSAQARDQHELNALRNEVRELRERLGLAVPAPMPMFAAAPMLHHPLAAHHHAPPPPSSDMLSSAMSPTLTHASASDDEQAINTPPPTMGSHGLPLSGDALAWNALFNPYTLGAASATAPRDIPLPPGARPSTGVDEMLSASPSSSHSSASPRASVSEQPPSATSLTYADLSGPSSLTPSYAALASSPPDLARQFAMQSQQLLAHHHHQQQQFAAHQMHEQQAQQRRATFPDHAALSPQQREAIWRAQAQSGGLFA